VHALHGYEGRFNELGAHKKKKRTIVKVVFVFIKIGE